MLRRKEGKASLCAASTLAKAKAVGLQHWKDLLAQMEEWPAQNVNFYPSMVFSYIELPKSCTRALHGGVCRGIALGGSPS